VVKETIGPRHMHLWLRKSANLPHAMNAIEKELRFEAPIQVEQGQGD
jgi:hypothetical protein